MEKLLRIFLNEIVKQGAADIGFAFRVGDGREPCCSIRFADERVALSLMRNPESAFGELYLNGKIDAVRGAIYDVLAGARGFGFSDVWRRQGDKQWLRLQQT